MPAPKAAKNVVTNKSKGNPNANAAGNKKGSHPAQVPKVAAPAAAASNVKAVTTKAAAKTKSGDLRNHPPAAVQAIETDNVKFLDSMPGFKRSVDRPSFKVFGAKNQRNNQGGEKVRLEFVADAAADADTDDDAEVIFDEPTEKQDVVVVASEAPFPGRQDRGKNFNRRERPAARFGSKVQTPSVQDNISNFFKRLPSFVPKNKQISQRKQQQQQQQQRPIGKRRLKFGERIE